MFTTTADEEHASFDARFAAERQERERLCELRRRKAGRGRMRREAGQGLAPTNRQGLAPTNRQGCAERRAGEVDCEVLLESDERARIGRRVEVRGGRGVDARMRGSDDVEARTRKRPPTGSEAAIDGRSTFRKERLSCASACLELWILFHASKAEIKQVRHLGGDEFLIDLHVLAPPLTYLSDAAGEDLPVDGRRCGIEPLLL